jgi:hypothetical protein
MSEMLRSYIKAAQQLKRASDARLKRERIVRSFVPAEHTELAKAHAAQLMDAFKHSTEQAQDAFVNFEAEFAANKFRFSALTNSVIAEAVQALSKLGAAVNDGNFAASETQLGLVKELYAELNDIAKRLSARGALRLLISMVLGRRQSERTSPLITQEEMDMVFALLHKRITTQAAATFKVFPPKCVLERPEILKAAQVTPELVSARFCILFQDGSSELVSLPALLVLVSQLLMMAEQQSKFFEQVEKAEIGVELSLRSEINPSDLMKPEIRSALLDKLDFANQPSEVVHPNYSAGTLQSFEANLRQAKRLVAGSPQHSVYHRKLQFGRWALHTLLLEDRTSTIRRFAEARKRRRKLRESGNCSEAPPAGASDGATSIEFGWDKKRGRPVVRGEDSE